MGTAVDSKDQNTTTEKHPLICDIETQRQCIDGSCISRMELCHEEMLNQDTILIMVGVGIGVVLFLVMLYCLQQRRTTHIEQHDADIDELDSPELLMPPPTYDDAVNVRLYPLTHRIERIPSAEEPVTPPPNYDTALHILAHSQENLCSASSKESQSRQQIRRAISVEHVGISRLRPMTFSSFGANSKTFVSRKTADKPPDASNS